MSKKVAILRGINVGGKRKILMKDLTDVFIQIGFKDVKSYIQSGNIIFSCTKNYSHEQLSLLLEQKILNKFGFDVPVIIRDKDELYGLIKNNPYYNTKADLDKLYVTLLQELPNHESLKVIETINHSPDLFSINDTNIYICCNGKYHQSKLSNTFFEKKLCVKATTRNWKTLMKLYEMIRE